MTPLRMLIIATFLFLLTLASVAADDCGCDFGWDGPGPSDGWDAGDDSTDNGGDNGGAGPSDDNGSGTADDSGGQSGTGDDSGSDSSSSDSGGSSGSVGGSAEDGLLWRMKGDDLYVKGLFNESLSAYEKAISFDPFSFKSWKGKGQALLALGRPEDAARAFLQALKLDPADAGTYALLGDARIAAGEYKDAAEQYLKALAMNPRIEGVSDKLSAAYAAENPVLVAETENPGAPFLNATPAEMQTVPVAVDTGTVTADETGLAIPPTTEAGFPGAFTAILGVLLGLLLIGVRQK